MAKLVEGLLYMLEQIVHYRGPIRELLGAELNQLAMEFLCTVLLAVVNQEIATVEVLVVRDDEAFVEDRVFVLAEVALHPFHLVAQR